MKRRFRCIESSFFCDFLILEGESCFSARCTPMFLGLFCCAGVSLLRERRGGFAVAPSTPSHCTPMWLEFFLLRGDFAPAGATRGLCARPLDPFAVHTPVTWFLSLQNRSALTENNISPPSEAKHNNNEGKPFSFGAESAIIDMLGKSQQRGNPAVRCA